jgi:hypothetical protein
VRDLDKQLLEPLAELIRANGRLSDAIANTRRFWSVVDLCWIDQLKEPTKLLQNHKIGDSHGHS